MPLSKIAGIGMYVPEKVVTNNDLKKWMDTDDNWIQERTGIQERRFAKRTEETTTTMAVEAAKIAIERAGITAQDIDFSTRGRNVSVIFGDGAGAVVLQPTEKNNQGILSTHLHSDGASAEILAQYNPGSHANHWVETPVADFDEAEIGEMFMSHQMIDNAQLFPFMDGPTVFKKAIVKFPEVIVEALTKNGYTTEDLNILIPHQANLRISQFVQQKLKLRDDQVYNNIMRYGNTTAASVPIALCEAWQNGKIKEGDLVCLAAFGSGFTWASALLKW